MEHPSKKKDNKIIIFLIFLINSTLILSQNSQKIYSRKQVDSCAFNVKINLLDSFYFGNLNSKKTYCNLKEDYKFEFIVFSNSKVKCLKLNNVNANKVDSCDKKIIEYFEDTKGWIPAKKKGKKVNSITFLSFYFSLE